eukprot:NODE_84_length_22349_cov_0.357888.p5 type:complete len:437 gc:universal NODE_84_length_22349_cov_0.357888:8406-7096(-)
MEVVGGITKPIYNLNSYLKPPLELWKHGDGRLREILEYKYAFRAAMRPDNILKKNLRTGFFQHLTLVNIEEIVNSITGLIFVDKLDSPNSIIVLSELVMGYGITEIADAIVQVKDNKFTCNCTHFVRKRRNNLKRRRMSKLYHFCRHYFFVSRAMLKRDAEHILDFTCNDISSFFVVHDHFDVFSQTHNDQNIVDLVWCPVWEQLLLKSELESDRHRDNCVLHSPIYLKTFMYYLEKKQQIHNMVYLSEFKISKDQLIQDISDMDPLMIDHWGLLFILVDIEDRSIIFNEEALTPFKNTFIWKYNNAEKQSILFGQINDMMGIVDRNEYEFVFHATTLDSAVSISQRIQPICIRYATELGPGFYCGTDMDVCLSYALSKDGRGKYKKFEKDYVHAGLVCFAVKKTAVELEIQNGCLLRQFIWSNRTGNYKGMTTDD